MGVCACRAKTEVTADPKVKMYVLVRGTGLLDSYGGMLISGKLNGLLYVKDNQLCYEATIGKGLWRKCSKKRWDLSQVTHMTVVRNQNIRVQHHKQAHYISMTPGLKVNLRSHSGHNQTLITSMPDADTFSTRLAQYINAVPR